MPRAGRATRAPVTDWDAPCRTGHRASNDSRRGSSVLPAETLREAQRLLDAGMPFHAHEVFEDAWKSGPEDERELWRGWPSSRWG